MLEFSSVVAVGSRVMDRWCLLEEMAAPVFPSSLGSLQIQEGAKGSSPDPPDLRGEAVSAVNPVGEWRWWHLVKATKEESRQKIFLMGVNV